VLLVFLWLTQHGFRPSQPDARPAEWLPKRKLVGVAPFPDCSLRSHLQDSEAENAT
jgi:hypothetical protein